MRSVFLLCAALTLAAAGPVEKTMDVQQNMQPEKNPGDLLPLMTGKFEREETVSEVVEGGKTPGDVRQSRNICPSGWSQYQSRCFIFIHREMSWIDAERYCLRNGANLASIHNPGEYTFIQEMVKGSTGRFTQSWIGGTDAIKDHMWFWSDGSALNFEHWSIDEPNNAGGNERCLEMNHSEDYLWNDLSCELEHTFVCGTRP